MSKSKRRRGRSAPQRKRNRLPLVIVAGGAMLIAGTIWAATSGEKADFVPAVTGAPRMVISQERVDYGDVKLNTPVETVFTIQNTGDQPLRILGEPQVELVEGC